MNIKGKILASDKFAVAIVGSRHPTNHGIKLAHDFSFYLAGHGVTIVSGMARGIDTIAHKGALAAGGRTIAVLGSGLGVIYPSENKKLSEEITRNGALVSPFPNDEKPRKPGLLFHKPILA